MRKLIALAVAIIMVVSMIPVMAFPTSAANADNMWTTYRTAADYTYNEDGSIDETDLDFKPAPGYEYTSDGFHTIPADYTDTTPFMTIQSKEAVNLKDGVYFEVRTDDFSYGGEPTEAKPFGEQDNWVAFSIWNQAKIAPGSTEYGQGWLCLIRHTTATTADVQSFVTTDKSFALQGSTSLDTNAAMDSEGDITYKLGVSFDGENYTITVNGVAVSGTAMINNLFKKLDPEGTGNFYVGITYHSGVVDGVAEATVTKFGTSEATAETPTGNETVQPEPNNLKVGEPRDPNEVPENEPALLFDANCTSHDGKIATQDMKMVAQGDGSYKVEGTNSVGFYQWVIDREITYMAEDFPVIAILIKDPNTIFSSFVLRYCAGKVMTANDIQIWTEGIYDDDNVEYDDGETFLLVVDLKAVLTEVDEEGNEDTTKFEESWNGRIHALRFDTNDLGVKVDEPDPESDFYYLMWAGFFRSVDEALAYTEAYMAKEPEGETGDETGEVEGTDAGVEGTDAVVEGTDAVVEGTDAAVEGTDAAVEGTDAAVEGTDAAVEGTDAAEEGTKAPAAAATDAATDATEEDGGCASVIGAAAVLMAAAAAAVVLKKKD